MTTLTFKFKRALPLIFGTLLALAPLECYANDNKETDQKKAETTAEVEKKEEKPSEGSASLIFAGGLLGGAFLTWLVLQLRRKDMPRDRGAAYGSGERFSSRQLEQIYQGQEQLASGLQRIESRLVNLTSYLERTAEKKTFRNGSPPEMKSGLSKACFSWQKLSPEEQLTAVIGLYQKLKTPGQIAVPLPRMIDEMIRDKLASDKASATAQINELFRQYPRKIGIEEPRFKNGEEQFFVR